MAEYLIQDTTLTGIADAIREKEGSAEKIPITDMEERIRSIETSIAPEISIDSEGLITATSGDKTNELQLSVREGETIIPASGFIDKLVVEKGKYTTGNIIVKSEPNLLASNIKSGTTIFNVTGTYSGEKIYTGEITGVSIDSSGCLVINIFGYSNISVLKNIFLVLNSSVGPVLIGGVIEVNGVTAIGCMETGSNYPNGRRIESHTGYIKTLSPVSFTNVSIHEDFTGYVMAEYIGATTVI